MVAFVLAWSAAAGSAAHAQYQLGDHITGFAEAARYQNELRLTDEQRTRAKIATRNANERLTGVSREIKDLPVAEKMKALRTKHDEIAAAYEKELADILSPAQLKRLGELTLQSRGAQAFQSAAVREALKLTEEQVSKIDAIFRNVREQVVAVGRMPRDPASQKKKAELARQISRELLDKSLAVLTPEQKKRWDELLGKPFKFQADP